LTLEEYKKFSPLFEEDVFEAISLENCVNERNVPGGPSVSCMESAIKESENWLNEIIKKME